MKDEEIQQALRFRIANDLRDEFISRIEESYSTAQKQYNPRDWSPQLFGSAVWTFLQRRLTWLVKDEGASLGVRVARQRHVFWLDVNGILLAPYRLPWFGNDEFEDSFPYNRSGAGRLTRLNSHRNQTELFVDGQSNLLPVGLVLAHAGSAKDGLVHVSLREPTQHFRGRISKWGFSETLWERVGYRSTEQPIRTNLPKAVDIGKPPVTPKWQPQPPAVGDQAID